MPIPRHCDVTTEGHRRERCVWMCAAPSGQWLSFLDTWMLLRCRCHEPQQAPVSCIEEEWTAHVRLFRVNAQRLLRPRPEILDLSVTFFNIMLHCIADYTFYSQGKTLNVPWSLKKYIQYLFQIKKIMYFSMEVFFFLDMGQDGGGALFPSTGQPPLDASQGFSCSNCSLEDVEKVKHFE